MKLSLEKLQLHQLGQSGIKEFSDDQQEKFLKEHRLLQGFKV